MEIEQKMKYATNLADLNFSHEFEDIFKLANLCEEIENLKDSGFSADSKIADNYIRTIKLFYKKSGVFRSEIEQKPFVKQFIHGI